MVKFQLELPEEVAERVKACAAAENKATEQWLVDFFEQEFAEPSKINTTLGSFVAEPERMAQVMASGQIARQTPFFLRRR